MKKTLVFVFLLLTFSLKSSTLAQTETQIIEPTQKTDADYRLFRTLNIWTFLKLDTRDGRMWQIQFGIEKDSRGLCVLNDQPLVGDKIKVGGRFTLYPTSNIYNFILLDQIDGRTWQVQWSTETETRAIIPINSFFK